MSKLAIKICLFLFVNWVLANTKVREMHKLKNRLNSTHEYEYFNHGKLVILNVSTRQKLISMYENILLKLV